MYYYSALLHPKQDFLDDDIEDDVKCVKRIYQDHEIYDGNGFFAWLVQYVVP